MQWLDDRETMQSVIHCLMGAILLVGATLLMDAGYRPDGWRGVYFGVSSLFGFLLIYIEFENFRRRRRVKNEN